MNSDCYVNRIRNVNDVRKKRAAAAALIVSVAYILKKPKIERRWWVRPWLENKFKGGLALVKFAFQSDPEQYRQFLRVSESTFQNLLRLVKPKIEKANTKFRNAISATDKLIVTLRFLATGESYRSLMYNFRISESTISLFIPQVCKVIYDVLRDEHLKVSFLCVVITLKSSYISF